MISSLRSRHLPWILSLVCAAAGGAAPSSKADADNFPDVTASMSWLFPLNPPRAGGDAVIEATAPVHLANSRVEFTKTQLTNLYFAPDWHPESHSPMPEIVLRGRAPGTYACGYCHLPGGQGRPENAALAGLPAAYIVQQVADFKSGARRSAWHGASYLPFDLMRQVAANADESDVAAAAAYFSAQRLRPRVTVIERTRIPRMQAANWIYVPDPRGGEEALGQRLIEWAPDESRHENRDDEMRYSAFVPPGSVKRGRMLATGRRGEPAQACTACHGEHLQGTGSIPPLAGRSPTYLLRQLVGFRTHDRAGMAGAPMQAVIATLGLLDMIAIAAYAAAE
jgi:cytochrome c553